MTLPYYPLYCADYIRDTRSLDFVEHGIYWMLMLEYYSTERPIRNDDATICRLLLNGINLQIYTDGEYDHPNGDVMGSLSHLQAGRRIRAENVFFAR